MNIKQILIGFWWIIGIAVIIISGLKINSFKLDVEPIDVSRDIALIMDKMGGLDMNANFTYFLEEGSDVRVRGGSVQFLSQDVVIESYPYVDRNNIKVVNKEGELILIKNG